MSKEENAANNANMLAVYRANVAKFGYGPYFACKTIAEFPVTDPANMDAWNMQAIARHAIKDAIEPPAIANKATEEGELPLEHYEFDGKWLYDADQVRQAIAADRASRQVANKAEVEPIAHLRFWASQSWSGNGNHGVEHGEGLEVCQPGEVGDDGKPAFPVFATPPATTGASTAELEQLRRDAARYQYMRNYYTDDHMEPPASIVDATNAAQLDIAIDSIIGANPARSVGASTVLTDERIEELCDEYFQNIERGTEFARAIEREVAAQAGQVAVPDDGLRLALKTIRAMAYSAPQTAQWISEAVHIADEALAAAPSAPAVAQQALADWISIEETEPPERELIALRYWPYDNRENPQAVTGGRYVDGTFYNDEGDELHPPSHWCRLPHFDAEATVQAPTPDGRQEGGAA